MAIGKLNEIVATKYKADDAVFERNKPVEAISSGSMMLDKILGGGLFIKGRITEVFGAESSGKSTSCLQSAASALKKGYDVIYLDFEQTFDTIYAEALGIDLKKYKDNFVIFQPPNLEQGTKYLRELEKIATEGKICIIIDSIAAAKPKELLEKAGEQQRVGLHAQRIGELSNYLSSVWCGKYKAAVLCTNQLRKVPSMGGMFQAKATKDTGIGFGVSSDTSVTTTGGMQIRYMYSVRVMLEYAGKIEEGSWDAGDLQRTGNKIKAYTVKNKIVPPFQTAQLAIVYGKGFVDDFAILDMLKEYEYITSGGGTYTFWDLDENDPAKGKGLSFKIKGKEAFYKRLEEPKIKAEMKRIYEYLMQNDEAVDMDEEESEGDEELE